MLYSQSVLFMLLHVSIAGITIVVYCIVLYNNIVYIDSAISYRISTIIVVCSVCAIVVHHVFKIMMHKKKLFYDYKL